MNSFNNEIPEKIAEPLSKFCLVFVECLVLMLAISFFIDGSNVISPGLRNFVSGRAAIFGFLSLLLTAVVIIHHATLLSKSLFKNSFFVNIFVIILYIIFLLSFNSFLSFNDAVRYDRLNAERGIEEKVDYIFNNVRK